MEVFGVAANFSDVLCHTFAVSGVLYSRGSSNRKKELRTEQRYIKNSYPNDDLTAFALSLGKYESRVCSLVCSELRKFRDFEDIVRKFSLKPAKSYALWSNGANSSRGPALPSPTSAKTVTGCNPGIIPMNLQKLILLEAGKGHLFVRKAIANSVRKRK